MDVLKKRKAAEGKLGVPQAHALRCDLKLSQEVTESLRMNEVYPLTG